jgi:hypothetical protein
VQRVIPPAVIDAVLVHERATEQRRRKFSMRQVVWVLIALACFTTLDMAAVLDKLTHAWCLRWPAAPDPTPTPAAFIYRRYHLGARPLVALFHTVCRPLASPTTPGAWLAGLRLMVLDGTLEDLPDTPANRRVFGRPGSDRGPGAFPQALGVYLLEAGTHAIVDAGFWPCHFSERRAAQRLLRSVTAGMLVLYDCGLHSYDFVTAIRARGAHALGRLPANVQPEIRAALPDGSYLAVLRPGDARRRDPACAQPVRLIRYTLTDPARPGYGEEHRLVTTVLDAAAAPALALAAAYHERWEVELTIDEVDTHQRLAGRPVRSRKPVGVIQELYALLLAHYVVRALMLEAATEQGLDADRLSFVGALRVVQEFVPDFGRVAPTAWASLYAQMRRKMARKRLPARRRRSNPRVVKRKMSKWPLQRAQHRAPLQPTTDFREAILLI